MIKHVFSLLLIIMLPIPCFGDFLISTESSLSTNLEAEQQLIPEIGLSLGWDTYSFLSEYFSFFLNSLGELDFNTVTKDIYGEVDLDADISYRSESFLWRLGVSSLLVAETNQEIELDIIPELYLSFGSIDYTVFTLHELTILALTTQLESYEGRVGVAFPIATLLNKPAVGVGVDLDSKEYPLYLIAEYELNWYPDPLISLDFSTGMFLYFTSDEYLLYYADLQALWYATEHLILTFELATSVTNSSLYTQPEVKLEPKVELGFTVTTSSILSFGLEGILFLTDSYLDEYSIMKIVLKFSYLM